MIPQASSPGPTSESGPAALSSTKVSAGEMALAVGLGALLLVLRWFYARNYVWNSDEPQHLHVVWAWATGRLPYRDVFDNHSPLFQFLCSPLFRWLGVRPDIVTPMRLAMTPFFALSLWCVYRLGATAFSRRAGFWAAAFTAFFPNFFFKMEEFRTDVLWTTLWLVTLVVLTSGRLTRQRLFWAGLTLGAAFSVSMKTSLLLVLLLLAGGATWLAKRFFTSGNPAPRSLRARLLDAAAALGGLAVVPALIVACFASKGALGPLYYGVIVHNTLPGVNTPWHVVNRFFSLTTLAFIPALLLGLAALDLLASDPARGSRRLFLLWAAAFFYPVLHGLWPMITPQDNLPWHPLVFVSLAPAVLWLGEYAPRWASRLALPGLLLGAEITALLLAQPLLKERNVARVETIAQALRLTRPDEYLMDAKGDTIYRPRPYYYVLETLTRKRLLRLQMEDDLPKRLIETRTAVVKPSDRMMEDSQAFVKANYLPVGRLSVLGQRLNAENAGPLPFKITIPGRYALVGPKGPVEATLDGSPLDGSRWLEPGGHELQLAGPMPHVSLVWARAVELGFLPFKKHPRTLP